MFKCTHTTNSKGVYTQACRDAKVLIDVCIAVCRNDDLAHVLPVHTMALANRLVSKLNLAQMLFKAIHSRWYYLLCF